MAEEFEGGVSCGENWWNLPNNNNNKNFFGGGSSLLGSTNDVAASFDWPPPCHGTTTTVILPNKRSTHHDSPGFSSSDDNNNSNQDFFAKSEDNYSNNNFGGDYYLNNNNNNLGDYPLQQQEHQVIPVLGSASYDYTSSLLQTLFETDDEPDHQINSNSTINHNYSSNYDQINISNDQFLPNTTNTHLPATWTNDFLPPPQSQSLLKNKNEGGKKEPAMKRARIQAPSPLPTFKVRKEKLGDRVTALQQLVSPFGKTDTASVLHEAIEYIKYLHDQVSVFSSPYLKNKSHPLQQHLHGGDDDKVVKKDDVLKSRGLCLVPISSTFPVSAEITTDFWTPIFGGDSFN